MRQLTPFERARSVMIRRGIVSKKGAYRHFEDVRKMWLWAGNVGEPSAAYVKEVRRKFVEGLKAELSKD